MSWEKRHPFVDPLYLLVYYYYTRKRSVKITTTTTIKQYSKTDVSKLSNRKKKHYVHT